MIPDDTNQLLEVVSRREDVAGRRRDDDRSEPRVLRVHRQAVNDGTHHLHGKRILRLRIIQRYSSHLRVRFFHGVN